jgi:hypothetical protein
MRTRRFVCPQSSDGASKWTPLIVALTSSVTGSPHSNWPTIGRRAPTTRSSDSSGETPPPALSVILSLVPGSESCVGGTSFGSSGSSASSAMSSIERAFGSSTDAR